MKEDCNVVVFICSLFIMARCSLVKSMDGDPSFRYEKLQNYGLGKRVIPNHRRLNSGNPYPEPLPTKVTVYIKSPYRSIFQGIRNKSDKRVYMKRFDYKPKPSGHRVFCQAIVDCKISHMVIETTDGIPIILGGGAGYNYFKAIIRAEAGVALKGTMKAYCRQNDAQNK